MAGTKNPGRGLPDHARGSRRQRERILLQRRRRRRRLLWAGAIAAVLAVAILVTVSLMLAERAGRLKAVGTFSPPLPTATEDADPPLSFRVTSPSCGSENVISAEGRASAKGMFCGIPVVVTNESEAPVPLPLSCQLAITSSRDTYSVHEAATRLAGSTEPFAEGIAAGPERKLELLFDLPEDARVVALQLHTTCGSDGVNLAVPPERKRPGG